MKTILQRICLILGWLYAGLIILWFVLHCWLGDTVWWLALLNSFAPLNNRLTNAHQAAGWGFGHTFPAYAGSFRGIPILPRQMRIDMIFYSEEFSALSSRVGSTYGESDHLPVLAQLAWQK